MIADPSSPVCRSNDWTMVGERTYRRPDTLDQGSRKPLRVLFEIWAPGEQAGIRRYLQPSSPFVLWASLKICPSLPQMIVRELAARIRRGSSTGRRPVPEAKARERSAGAASPTVSVIIPVYRDRERLNRCLRALAHQTVPAERFEVLVINNEPAPWDLDPSSDNVRILHEPRPGSYAARNKGLACARGILVAFTDSDCVPDANWIERAILAWQATPDTRIAGCIATFREPGTSGLAYIYDVHTAFPQEQYVNNGVAVTANLIVPRSVLDRVGCFDEILSGGDIAWNRRAEALGLPIVYREDVRVRHPARRSLGAIISKRRRTVAASLGMPPGRFIFDRTKPPIRRFLILRRDGVKLGEALIVCSVHWVVRLIQIVEFSALRLGLKRPRRS